MPAEGSYSRRPVIQRWASAAARHGLGQVVGQGAAFASGILIVRELSKTDYATYSLSSWLIASVTLIADAGISSMVLSIGQGVRDRRSELRKVFEAAGNVRIRIGAVGTSVGLLWLLVLYRGNGVAPQDMAFALLTTGVTLMPSIAAGVFQGYHRINLDVARLRSALWLPGSLRLALVAGFAWIGWLDLHSVLFIASVVSLFTVWWLARGTTKVTLPKPANNPEYSPAMRTTAMRVLPAMVALVVSEQVMYSVMSLRGSPEVLAEYAALSRFGLVFALLNPIVSDIAAPMFARLRVGWKRLGVSLGLFVVGYVLLATMLTLGVWVASPLLLSILGPQYGGLWVALVVTFAASGVSSLGYALNVVTLSRGWATGSWLYLPLAGAWVVGALVFARVDNAQDAALLYLSQVAIWPAMQLVRASIGLRGMGTER